MLRRSGVTSIRAMIHAVASRLKTPVTLVASVVEGQELSGLFSGDSLSAWSEAADLLAECHICWLNTPFQRGLSCTPPMYDEFSYNQRSLPYQNEGIGAAHCR
jgi:hypothetical protein